MIGWLSGKVVQAVPDRLILDVGGVGYLVAIPLSTYYEIQKADAGAAIRLFIHTHVREDALALYGFWSEREKELFEQLIAVSGIGPRLAQVVLSGMAPDELVAQTVAAKDAGFEPPAQLLERMKTAERMVVELRDKLQALAAQLPAARAAAAAAGGSDNDLVAALVNLGYKPSLAEGAVGAARKEAPEAAFHELLRLALRRLSRV